MSESGEDRFAMRIKALLAVIYVPLVVVLLLLPLAARNRLERALFDSVHAPLFALLAVALYLLLSRYFPGRPGRCAICAGVAAAALGTGLEVLQMFTQRSSSWQDGLANLLGAAAGALCMAAMARSRPARYGLLGLAGVCLSLAEVPPMALLADVAMQRYELPRVASFESSLEMSRWQTRECSIRRVEEHASDGRFAMRVDLEGQAKYPGPIMADPGGNWSGNSRLRFDVWLDGETPLPIVVKIYDAGHNGEVNDRFHRQIVLLPGPNYLKISLAEVAAAPRKRQLDLHAVTLVQFFAIEPATPRTLFFDNLRLE